jgi:hypothetical protein
MRGWFGVSTRWSLGLCKRPFPSNSLGLPQLGSKRAPS